MLSKILNFVCTGWPSVNNDKSMSVYFNRQSELSVEQGCLLWGARVVIPESGQKHVLKLIHETHPGIVKMKAIVRRVIWWPNIDTAIEQCF